MRINNIMAFNARRNLGASATRRGWMSRIWPWISPSNSRRSSSVANLADDGGPIDPAAEFTNLILAQRGFQANSQVVTASDELLADIVKLKRWQTAQGLIDRPTAPLVR